MSIVANLDVNVRGNTSDLSVKLTKAEKELEKLAKAEQKEADKARKDYEDMLTKKQVAAATHFNNITRLASAALTGSLPAIMSGVTNAASYAIGLTKGPLAAAAVNAVGMVAGVAASGVEVLLAKISGGMDRLANLALLARSLGESEGVLAGVQLAGQLAGQSLDEVNNSIRAFTQNINLAGIGAGPSLLALTQLGIRGRELTDLPLDKKLERIADAFTHIKNASDRSRIAQGLGLEGMLPALTQGREGIQKMIQEARLLGMSDPVAARQALEAKQAWTRLRVVTDALWMSLASNFAPVLSAVATGLANVGQNSQSAFRVVGQTAGEVSTKLFGIGAAISGLIGQAASMGHTWTLLAVVWLGGTQLIVGALAAIEFGLANWQGVLVIGATYVQLWIERISQSFIHLATSIVPTALLTMHRAFEAATSGDISGFIDALSDGVTGLFNREKSELEVQLEGTIDLGLTPWAEFIDRRINEFRNRPNLLSGPATPNGPSMSGIPAKMGALEAGSKEAFSVIYGTQDKQAQALRVANEQLAENRLMRQALERLARNLANQNIRRGNL